MEAQDRTALQSFLYPDANELSHSEMPIWDHLDELRERILIAALAAGASIATCFCFSKDLVVFLEAPVARQGVRFLQLSPGEFFFTTFKVDTTSPVTALPSMFIYLDIMHNLPNWKSNVGRRIRWTAVVDSYSAV